MPCFFMHRGIEYYQQSMYVEAVQEEATPSREKLVRDFMKIECRHCTVAYHLYHVGLALNVLHDFFLQASWEIRRQHPDHDKVISLARDSITAHERAS